MPRVWVRQESPKLVVTVLLGAVLLGACAASTDARSAPPAARSTTSVSAAPTTEPVVPVTAPAKEMHWTPKSGPRGAVVSVWGTLCNESTVYISFYGPRGDNAAASAKAAVKPDHTWSAEVVVPQNAQLGHWYAFEAVCGTSLSRATVYDPSVAFHVDARSS